MVIFRLATFFGDVAIFPVGSTAATFSGDVATFPVVLVSATFSGEATFSVMISLLI